MQDTYFLLKKLLFAIYQYTNGYTMFMDWKTKYSKDIHFMYFCL